MHFCIFNAFFESYGERSWEIDNPLTQQLCGARGKRLSCGLSVVVMR